MSIDLLKLPGQRVVYVEDYTAERTASRERGAASEPTPLLTSLPGACFVQVAEPTIGEPLDDILLAESTRLAAVAEETAA